MFLKKVSSPDAGSPLSKQSCGPAANPRLQVIGNNRPSATFSSMIDRHAI